MYLFINIMLLSTSILVVSIVVSIEKHDIT